MSVALAVPLFAVATVVTLVASARFAAHLDHAGSRLGLTDALLGVLTAVAADGPEVTSAVTALIRGEHDVGVGVVLGSCAFNLAAMIGLGAIIARGIRPRRASLAIEGVVAVAALVATATVVGGAVAPVVGLALLAVVLVPYIAVLALGDRRVHLLPLPRRAHDALGIALGEGFVHREDGPARPHGPLGLTLAAMAVSLAGIIGGSVLLVDSALAIADHAGIGSAVVGFVVLAILTSLPNAFTAIRLARLQRADAVVSETMNSNTINLVAGVLIPAVLLGSGVITGGGGSLAWLALMTGVALLLLGRRRGIGVAGGALVIGMYAVLLVAVLR
jgi:cation:H+ antiporter